MGSSAAPVRWTATAHHRPEDADADERAALLQIALCSDASSRITEKRRKSSYASSAPAFPADAPSSRSAPARRATAPRKPCCRRTKQRRMRARMKGVNAGALWWRRSRGWRRGGRWIASGQGAVRRMRTRSGERRTARTVGRPSSADTTRRVKMLVLGSWLPATRSAAANPRELPLHRQRKGCSRAVRPTPTPSPLSFTLWPLPRL